jgi:hypothetical protein
MINLLDVFNLLRESEKDSSKLEYRSYSNGTQYLVADNQITCIHYHNGDTIWLKNNTVYAISTYNGLRFSYLR